MKTTFYLAFYLYLCGFVFIGCNEKSTQTVSSWDEDVVQVLSLEHIASVTGEEFLSSITNDIQYIPLETTDEALLRQMNHITFLNNGNIVISDASKIFMYSPEGKYIRTVSQAGNGPADYTRISGLLANAKTGGFFLNTRTKIIEFDVDGKFVNHFNTVNLPSNVTLDADGTILLYQMDVPIAAEDTTTAYSLYRFNPATGEKMMQYANVNPRIRKEGTHPFVIMMRPLYLYNGKVRFNEVTNDTIFFVEADSLRPYVIMDLGDLRVPFMPEGPSAEATYAEIAKKLTPFFLMEDERFLYMVFSWGISNTYQYCTYNKENKQVTNYGNGGLYSTEYGLTNDIDGGLPFYPQTITPDGVRIMCKNVEEFKRIILAKDYETEKKKYGDTFEKVWQLAESLDEEDNPVLVLVK